MGHTYGQKNRKYSKEFKEQIKTIYLNGNGTKNSISRDYDLPIKTVGTWIDKWNHPERYLPKGKKKGRPKDSETDWKEKYEILKKYQAFLKAQRERK
ncbi:MAG: transposase [Firmicutes bacterium]|nr:transposase [Candidatus Colivicinus equi]